MGERPRRTRDPKHPSEGAYAPLAGRLHGTCQGRKEQTQDRRQRMALGAAILVLTLLTCFPAADSQTTTVDITTELQPLGHSALDVMTSIWSSGPLACGPDIGDPEAHWMTTCTCMEQRWRESHLRQHPAAVAEPLEPGLRQTIHLWLHWHPCLPHIRAGRRDHPAS